MSREITGGHISERAAAVLKLERGNGRSGGEAVSEGLELLGDWRYGRRTVEQQLHQHITNQTIINEAPRFNGWFANSFNWFNNIWIKVKVAVIARLPDWIDPEMIPRILWALGGATGLLWMLAALGAF